MKKPVATIITSMSLAVVGALGVAGAASAGNPNLCSDYYACIYANDNFIGLIDIPRTAGGGLRNVKSVDNDKMDSWENRTTSNASWYHDANGGGDCVNMHYRYEDDDINVFDSDELTSWRTDRGC